MVELCKCGKAVVSRTSWSDLNPGRRFKACEEYRNGGCGYFNWLDPPACHRCHHIIPGLLRNINSKVEELEQLKKEVTVMKRRIWKITFVFVAVMVVFCSFMY